MGDLNAIVGRNTEAWDNILGCHGEDVINESGERLLRFCSVNELIVANTWYSHKDIHKLSWVFPRRQLKSLINSPSDPDEVDRINKGETHDKVDRGVRIRIERRKDRHEQLRYQCRIRQKMNRRR